jgi:hypothetical protein
MERNSLETIKLVKNLQNLNPILQDLMTINDEINNFIEVKTYSPIWTGAGLTYSSNPATGSYVKIGRLVHFTINVICTNVTNFGTGQYSITLPFIPSVQYAFRDGQIFDDSANQHYRILGEGIPATTTMLLWYGGTTNDLAFKFNTPVNLLAVADDWYVSGTYIIE